MELEAPCFILLTPKNSFFPGFSPSLMLVFSLISELQKLVVTNWPPRVRLQLTCTSHILQKECKLSINRIMYLSTISFRAKLLRIIRKSKTFQRKNISSKLASIFKQNKYNNTLYRLFQKTKTGQSFGKSWSQSHCPDNIQGNQIIPQVNNVLKTFLRHREGLKCPDQKKQNDTQCEEGRMSLTFSCAVLHF